MKLHRNAALMALEESLAYMQVALLNQLLLRRVPDGWQAIVKASRGGNNLVAYVTCESFGDLIEVVTEWGREGRFDWRPDRYPPKHTG